MDAIDSAPLSMRGWTLQERLLSNRILHFGEDQIHFECRSGQYSEDGHADEYNLAESNIASIPTSYNTHTPQTSRRHESNNQQHRNGLSSLRRCASPTHSTPLHSI